MEHNEDLHARGDEMEKWEYELEKAFCKRLGIKNDELDAIKDDYIFGLKVQMPVREAVLLYFDIEKITKKKVPEQFLIAGEFSTYEKIKKIVGIMMDS